MSQSSQSKLRTGEPFSDVAAAKASATGPATKILPLEVLEKACAQLRGDDFKLVLCHGVFDLLHVGHIRHFAAAKKFGDILVVTLTADQYVNKGPDRPAFPAELRAEFLASVADIDYVAIVDEASAAPAIRAVKPHFYVKGGEYADAEADITGKISVERDMVEQAGGELVFTEDITFSSSNLLNRHFSGRDKAMQTFLDEQRAGGLESRLTAYLEKAADMKVLIVGETIIDHYTYVAPMGKAAKENIIATLYRDEEVFAGGVVAAANHLSAVCPNVELITMLGDPKLGDNYESLIRESLRPSINLTVIEKPDSPTVRKQRFVEPTYVRKLFEVYRMEDRPLTPKVEAHFHEQLAQKVREADLVILNDFGHGFIGPSTVDLISREAKFLAVNAQSNAGNIGYNLISKYAKADFICIDAMEAWLAVRDKHANLSDVVANRLPAIVECDNIVVTHGRTGCYVSDGSGGASHIPAFNTSVVDTVGAGDAFFVVAAPMLAAGADCQTAGFMGNVAGAISICIVGHRRYLDKLEIQRYITTLLK
ncbi:MAG: adenylyltransferase/cytidyltransferase family protein [Gammaproteobacteria bacterium]|nr:adenylyltransferase/cytidyltransferase family protein [Gammaproteobacteria bacterium]